MQPLHTDESTGFTEFWRALDAEQKKKFAKRCDRSVGYLFLVAGGHRDASPQLARTFERESRRAPFNGRVIATKVRPDIFGTAP